MRVALFTDNDFDKVNGVTTTLRAVLRHAPPDLQPRVYTLSDLEVREPDYLALASPGIGIPYYAEMRMYLPRLSALARAARADGVGLVHLTTPGPMGLAARWVARRLGTPLSGSFHTHLAEYAALLSGSPMLGRAMNRYMRWLYGACAPVLVPSAATRSRLIGDGWPRARLAVWSRGVDTALFDPARRSASLRDRWRVSDRRPAVLYAGRLSREKGLSDVRAMASALHRWHVPHRLIFVGDGPYRAGLAAACPDAVFMGTLAPADVAVAMASADLFLFPSTTDSLGNVVLEAQASGLPVIVSDEGGPQENMLAGTTGFVCRGGDAVGFAGRILELARRPDVRAEMSAHARAYALTRQWPHALRPLYQAWRAAAAGAPPPVHALVLHEGKRP